MPSSWKRQKRLSAHRAAQSSVAGKRWKTSVLAAFFLVATVGLAVLNFPSSWNRGLASAGSLVGRDLSFVNLSENPFRLGLDLQGGTHLVYEADMAQIPSEDRENALQGARDVIERRVNAFGVAEPVVQTTSAGGSYRVFVELAGVLDVKEAIKQIGETPILEFKEEGQQLDRAPTEEETAELARRQNEDRGRAQEVFVNVQAGTDPGTAPDGKPYTWQSVKSATLSLVAYAPILKAIEDASTPAGSLVTSVIETPEGLNIVRFVKKDPAKELLLSHLLICFEGKMACTNPIPSLEAATKIRDLRAQATPENFAVLADQNSTDRTTPGGDLGWLSPGQTIPAFESAASALSVGNISDVVETDFGYHLIFKREERPVTVYAFERILLPLTSITDIVPPASPWKNTELSGKQLKRATVQFDQQTGTPMVSLQFNDEGSKLFGELTAKNVGKPVAIFLDGAPISTPVVNEAIYGGSAVITGDFTIEEAKTLAQRLNAGALPVPVQLLSQETVGPTLGLASLTKSVQAALIGFLLVSLFMIVVYRLPGVLATLALVFYAMLNLFIYRLFGVTVTLAGVAGLVLSLGIAVDANVLIFERFKDEFRSGRDLASSLEEGFRRAWPPIRDGHATTLISALVLFSFSSSFVKGFALTLAIGVLLSLFTAIVVVRAYLRTIRGWRWFKAPWFYRTGRSSVSER